MYITPRQKKQIVVRTILLIIGLPLTIYAAYFATQLVSNAGQESEPLEVVKSNLTSNSITLTWITSKEATGSVVMEAGGKEVVFPDSRGNISSKVHFVEVTNLDPSSNNTFSILSGRDTYDNSEGADLKFFTLGVSSDFPVPNPVFGDAGSSDIIVHALLPDQIDSTTISTVTSTAGSWYLDLSGFRDSSGDPISSISVDTKITLLFQTADGAGILEGVYSDFFSDDGEFTSTVEITDGESIMSSLPTSATLFGLGLAPVEPAPIIVPDPAPEDTTEPDVETDSEPEEREFRVASQIEWVDIAQESATTPTLDLPTGAQSMELVSLTDTSAMIIWLTPEGASGKVTYGIDPLDLTETARDKRDSLLSSGEYMAHIVELTSLLPETKYYYSVSSGTETFDDNGSPLEFTTFSTLSSPPEFVTTSGSITGLSDPTDSVVVAELIDKDSTGSSNSSWKGVSIPDQNGSWSVSIGDLRSEDGSEYFDLTDGDDIAVSLLAFAQSEPEVLSAVDVSESTVEIKVSSSPTSSGPKVGTLTDEEYKVITGTGSYYPAVGGGGEDGGTVIPNTGLFDNMYSALAVSGALVSSGVLYFVFSKKKPESKNVFNRMSDRI